MEDNLQLDSSNHPSMQMLVSYESDALNFCSASASSQVFCNADAEGCPAGPLSC